jgi:hypothetical protein
MASEQLPAGWTPKKIRRPAQDERIHPETVLGLHGLCLVKPDNDDDWYMGSLKLGAGPTP